MIQLDYAKLVDYSEGVDQLGIQAAMKSRPYKSFNDAIMMSYDSFPVSAQVIDDLELPISIYHMTPEQRTVFQAAMIVNEYHIKNFLNR